MKSQLAVVTFATLAWLASCVRVRSSFAPEPRRLTALFALEDALVARSRTASALRFFERCQVIRWAGGA